MRDNQENNNARGNDDDDNGNGKADDDDHGKANDSDSENEIGVGIGYGLQEVCHLGKDISVARALPHHRDEMFRISEKVWEGEDYIPNLWDLWIQEEGFYVILLRERVIGSMKYTKLPGQEILLEGLRMDPEMEGKGYASLAVDHFMGLVDAQEPRLIRFATSDENVYSHHFGEKYGFEFIASFYHRYMKGPEIREKLIDIRNTISAPVEESDFTAGAPGEVGVMETMCNTSSDDFRRVLGFMKRSGEWEHAQNLISNGWVFFTFAEDRLRALLDSEYSFILERNGDIMGILLADHSIQYPTDIDISWITGDEMAVHALLTKLFLSVDEETVQEIAGKPSTAEISGFMENFGFHRHPRVDGTHVFEKHYP